MTESVHMQRSTLVVPSFRRSMIEKAIGTDVDCLQLDFEDAVASTDEAKTEARRTVLTARRELDFGDHLVSIRVNSIDSRWLDADLEACIEARPHAVALPKVATAEDVASLDERLTNLGAPPELRIWPGIETVSGVVNCDQIAQSSPRIETLRFGFADYTNTMHGQLTETFDHLYYPLTKVLAAARMHGLFATAPTVVFGDIRRLDLVRNQALQLRLLGYDGATVIHPSHIAEIHAVFTPTPDEIDWALKQERALALAHQEGTGVVMLDGHLVENLHISMAQRTLAIARKLGLAAEAV
ncbi:MAG: citrate lyase subunit beta / citryl-CoA lyase [Chloroflexota bacterium]|jgi:citrate lyase subunit beta/citryl-CoA lyase|nr:citrate lyase subunit beta / citryl-CoA lyase [Chloroflexota bacterium]